jgi:hypothetical protein
MSIPRVRSAPQIASPPAINPAGRSLIAKAVRQIAQRNLPAPEMIRTANLFQWGVHTLPDEAALACFQWLDWQSLIKCCRVSKDFLRLAVDAALWRPLLRRDWEVDLPLASKADPRRVYLNLSQGICTICTANLPAGTTCFYFIKEDLFLIGQKDGTVSLFQCDTGSLTPLLKLETPIKNLHLNGYDFVIETNGTVLFGTCNTQPDASLMTQSLDKSHVSTQTMSCCGNRIAVAAEQATHVYDMQKQLLGTLEHHFEEGEEDEHVTVVLVTPKNICVGLSTGFIEIWTHGLLRIARYKAHTDRIDCLYVMYSNLFSSSATGGFIQIRDITNGNFYKVIKVAGACCMQLRARKLFFDDCDLKILDITTKKITSLSDIPEQERTTSQFWIRHAKIYSASTEKIRVFDFAAPSISTI